jgi:hypothetical protein
MNNNLLIFLVIVAIWFILGLVGTYLFIKGISYDRDEIYLSDLLFGLFFSLMGPIAILMFIPESEEMPKPIVIWRKKGNKL